VETFVCILTVLLTVGVFSAYVTQLRRRNREQLAVLDEERSTLERDLLSLGEQIRGKHDELAHLREECARSEEAERALQEKLESEETELNAAEKRKRERGGSRGMSFRKKRREVESV